MVARLATKAACTSETPQPTLNPSGSQNARSIDILRVHPNENFHVKTNA
jgi:hypothetical protein